MRKRIQKISIILGISLVIVLCGAFLFLRSDAFLNWVETRLASELESRIAKGYKAVVGDIKGSIFGNITISGVKISKEDEPVISTGRVVLKYNVLGLLTRKFEVTELTVDDPEIRAKIDLDGKLNLSNTFLKNPSNKDPLPSEDTPQFSFAVEDIHLNSGKINYTDTQRDLEISIQGLSLR